MKLVDKIQSDGCTNQCRNPEDAAQALNLVQKVLVCSVPNICSMAKEVKKPLFLLRKMIVSKTETERREALNELYILCKERY